ncbi:MAG: enoyl-CoA hydratase/isomerase family protein [Deltaproteobacteria bacterium]|nr:enoyl-CoA hydratase/isomerase family protein [Deltaproteobacteria bacterium]
MQARLREQAGPVWRIELGPGGRDEVTITCEGLQELLDLLAEAERAAECRVLVLQAGTGGFCRGMDLATLAADPERETSVGLPRYAACLRALRESSKVVVALVDGAALGGGLGLAASADVLLATSRSSFGLPELMLGLVPAMVLPVLMQRLAPQKARLLALRLGVIDGAEARRIGLVDELCADEGAMERALRAELKNLLRIRPDAVPALKRFAALAATLDPADAVEAGRRLTAERTVQAETVAAVRSFVAGEPLGWLARYWPEGVKR